MSRRQTPHAKREKSRSRRAIDRAIIRAVRDLKWGALREFDSDRIVIDREPTIELIGLCLARRRV